MNVNSEIKCDGVNTAAEKEGTEDGMLCGYGKDSREICSLAIRRHIRAEDPTH
jgi:hypothetical protein